MEVHNLRVKHVIYESNILRQHKKAKATRYSARNLKNLCISTENLAEGLRSTRERCWSYVVSVFKNTTKNLVAQEGRSWSNVVTQLRSLSRLHAYTSIPDI